MEPASADALLEPAPTEPAPETVAPLAPDVDVHDAPAGDLEPDLEPRWIADLFLLWKREILAFLTTALALLGRPRRFGAEWSSGRLDAMPPISFVLASATVLLPLDYGMQRVLQWDTRPDVSLAVDIARASKPFVLAILIGLATHGVLRLFGSRRSASTTVGILIYGTAIAWSLWCIGLVACAVTGAGGGVPNIMSALSGVWLALLLEGAHRIRWWWCAIVTLATGFPILLAINAALSVAGLT